MPEDAAGHGLHAGDLVSFHGVVVGLHDEAGVAYARVRAYEGAGDVTVLVPAHWVLLDVSSKPAAEHVDTD